MGPLANRLEIKQAEAHIERSASRLLNGELDRLGWHQALCQYEQTWLMLLDEMQPLELPANSKKDRHAA